MDNEVLNQTLFLLKKKCEPGTLAFLGSDLYHNTMVPADIFDDVQSDPKAPRYTVSSIVTLEDTLSILYTSALILYREEDTVRFPYQCHGDLGIVFGVLDRIGEGIVQDTGEFNGAEIV